MNDDEGEMLNNIKELEIKYNFHEADSCYTCKHCNSGWEGEGSCLLLEKESIDGTFYIYANDICDLFEREGV